MGFWVSLIVSLALTIVGELLRPKQKFKDPKPSALGDFSFPTADSTRVVQVFWGTCKLAGPNTTWFGDLETQAIKKKVKTGWFSSTTMTQGFKYYLGVQMVYGYGELDELIDFRLDEKSVFGTGPNKTNMGGFDGTVPNWLSTMVVGDSHTTDTTTIYNEEDCYSFVMNSPSLLGNDDPKNGVSGPVKIYKGKKTQMPNAYLMAQWGETEGSGFRPLIHVVMEHCYLGNSDTPPPPILYARRTPNPLGLTLGRHNILGDANPANMCYEVMTDMIFGMKIAPSKIDVPAFVAVANVLAAEELGLSMMIDTALKGKDLLAEILRHVDGVIYADPETGLYTIKLARDDYDVNTLDIFDESNIDAASFEFSRMSWEETANTTVVNYTDRFQNFISLPVTYQDLANVFVRNGQIVSETIEFQGFSRADQAMKAAARANKTRSSPLCRLTFNTNREGYKLRPGMVIKVAMPVFGISELVARITEISYGTLDDPAVKVVCVEDIFVVNTLAYHPPGGGGFTPPGSDPVALVAQRIEEAPHFGAGTNDRVYVFTMGAQSGRSDLGYEAWSDPAGGTAYARTSVTNDFTPSGVLTAAFNANGPDVDKTGFTIGTGNNISHIDQGVPADRDDGRNLVLIGNEIMAWRDFTDNGNGTYTFHGVYRAVLDTLPQDHAIGDRVWFFSEGVALVEPEGYAGDTTVRVKLLPYNGRGTLPLASATSMLLTTNDRSLRPLPPGKVRLDLQRPIDITGTVVDPFGLTWAERNRLDTTVYPQDAATRASESGTSYNLRFYRVDTNALLVQKTGILAASVTAALAYTGSVRMELEAQRNGLVSWQKHSNVFNNDANGTTTSVITEGAATTGYILDGGTVTPTGSGGGGGTTGGGGTGGTGTGLPVRTRGTTVVDPVAFGASTSADGTTNANAFNAAYASLPTSGANQGGIVRPSAGTYMIDPLVSVKPLSYTLLDLYTNNVTLQGSYTATDHKYVVMARGLTQFEIDGGAILGYRDAWSPITGTTSEWGHCLAVYGCTYGTVRRCTWAKGVGDGCSLGPYLGVNCDNLRFDNIISTNNRRQGLSIGLSTNITVTNSEFSYTNGTAPQAGIDIEIDKPYSGTAREARYVTIDNCHLHHNNGVGILCYISSKDVTLTNNTIEYNNYGIYVRGSTVGTVTGNTIRHNKYKGIQLGNSTISGVVYPTSSYSISGNIFFNNSTGANGLILSGGTTAHTGTGSWSGSAIEILSGVTGTTVGSNNYGP